MIWSIVWSQRERRCCDESNIDDRAVTLLELHSHEGNNWKIARHQCHFPLILHFFFRNQKLFDEIWWSNPVWHSQPGVKTMFFQSQLKREGGCPKINGIVNSRLEKWSKITPFSDPLNGKFHQWNCYLQMWTLLNGHVTTASCDSVTLHLL